MNKIFKKSEEVLGIYISPLLLSDYFAKEYLLNIKPLFLHFHNKLHNHLYLEIVNVLNIITARYITAK